MSCYFTFYIIITPIKTAHRCGTVMNTLRHPKAAAHVLLLRCAMLVLLIVGKQEIQR